MLVRSEIRGACCRLTFREVVLPPQYIYIYRDLRVMKNTIFYFRHTGDDAWKCIWLWCQRSFWTYFIYCKFLGNPSRNMENFNTIFILIYQCATLTKKLRFYQIGFKKSLLASDAPHVKYWKKSLQRSINPFRFCLSKHQTKPTLATLRQRCRGSRVGKPFLGCSFNPARVSLRGV